MPLIKFLNFLHSLRFNIYASPRAFQQLPAFIWFHIWFPRGLSTLSCVHLVSISKAHPHLCLSTTSCTHAVSISKRSPSSLHNFLHASSFGFNVQASPLISQQLFALILFPYLTFPSPQCASQLPASIWFHM